MPRILQRARVKALVNWGPRSDMALAGRPCNLNTKSANSRAVCSEVISDEQGIKWAILDNRSTMTRIESFPLLFGRPRMKSIDTDCQRRWGTGSGDRYPKVGCRTGLVLA